MKKVDIFIVGQPKSGTTALAHFLDQHPEICTTIPKEPAYMAKDLIAESDAFHKRKKYFSTRTAKDYQDTFKHSKAGQRVCDASTCYLYSKDAAREIKKYNPKAKIIIMLRNPVNMIYSLHSQYLNETQENIQEFSEALEAESSRKMGSNIPSRAFTPSYLFYRQRGHYYDQVKRFIDTFGKHNVHIIISEEFRNDNSKIYTRVLKFLKVKDVAFQPDFEGVHESKAPRSRVMNSLAHISATKNLLRTTLGQKNYTWLQKRVIEPILLRQTTRKKIEPKVEEELKDYFRNDVRKLSKLTGLDLANRWGIN